MVKIDPIIWKKIPPHVQEVLSIGIEISASPDEAASRIACLNLVFNDDGTCINPVWAGTDLGHILMDIKASNWIDAIEYACAFTASLTKEQCEMQRSNGIRHDPITITEFHSSGRTIHLKEPLVFEVTERGGLYHAETEVSEDLSCYEERLSYLMPSILSGLDNLWTIYAMEDDSYLTDKAIELKRLLLGLTISFGLDE